ncbi:MAG: DUF3108 domain-containing protein [Candidatus Theseobacter exili]|nr:DUF3108 domain-containing protein [Candidatus Theseobacter exili]
MRLCVKIACLAYLLNFLSTCCYGEDISRIPFAVGEKLTYTIRWGVIPVGYGILHVQKLEILNGREVYKIVASARSNEFLSKFYKVDDKVETWIDKEGLFPVKFHKKLQEGGYRCDEEMIFDQVKHRAAYRSASTEKHMDIPSRVQDALSSLYFFRTLDFIKQKTFFMDVNADEKNWKLEIDVIRKKDIDIRGLGGYTACLIEPKAKYQGIFVKKGRIFVWISADKLKLPLLMKSKVPFGSVTAALTKIEREIL